MKLHESENYFSVFAKAFSDKMKSLFKIYCYSVSLFSSPITAIVHYKVTKPKGTERNYTR